jgi:hypothetical protein
VTTQPKRHDSRAPSTPTASVDSMIYGGYATGDTPFDFNSSYDLRRFVCICGMFYLNDIPAKAGIQFEDAVRSPPHK